MKKFLKQLGCCIFFASLLTCVAFATGATEEELDMAYREYCTVAEEMDKFVTLDYCRFIDNYEESGLTLDEYYKQCVADLENNESLSAVNAKLENMRIEYEKTMAESQDAQPYSSLKKWWHNTASLPQATSYSKYGLLNLKPGDIIYEADGSFGFSAHIAIVDGIYYSSTYRQNYVRLVEAINDGVCFGILCDDRFSKQSDIAFRIKTSSTIANRAVDFAVSQIGKPYKIANLANLSEFRPHWYCSLLGFAAYYNASNGTVNISEEHTYLDGRVLISPTMIMHECSAYHSIVAQA